MTRTLDTCSCQLRECTAGGGGDPCPMDIMEVLFSRCLAAPLSVGSAILSP